jgi:quercetin dioxygenase-like cupin family protein
MTAVLRCVPALLALFTVGLTVPAEAGATPTHGITGVILARTTIGGTDYILRELTIAPGGSTGWHYHDGPVYGIVRQGVVSHYDATCRSDMRGGPGSVIVEQAGSGHVHIERNEGTEPQVLDVLYTLPAGSPLAEDAPNPGCPFN